MNSILEYVDTSLFVDIDEQSLYVIFELSWEIADPVGIVSPSRIII